MDAYDYIAHETERQSGTIQEALGMYRALRAAREWDDLWLPLGHQRLLTLATFINRTKGYRQMPAVFSQGEPAIHYSLVPRAMERLSEQLKDYYHDPAPREDADFLTKEFLLIHPFADGNGRVASLMWNFLLRTLDSPEPMPYFFGQD